MSKRSKNSKKSTNSEKYLHKKYFVQGMHCASCESLIEKDISSEGENIKVTASLKEEHVTISVPAGMQHPNIEDLNSKFSELGYKFFEKKPEAEKMSETDIMLTLLIVFGVLIFFMWTEKSGFFINHSLNESSSAIPYLVFGLIAGISSCAALVGGILLSLSDKWNSIYNGNEKQSAKPFLMFNAGRIISFIILGGLLGVLGSAFVVSPEFNAWLLLIVSIIMLILGAQMLGLKIANKISIRAPKFLINSAVDEKNWEGKYIPFVIGAVTFFVPCGFTLIAQTTVVASGGFVNGALRMGAFALGTLPILALISFTSVKLHTNKKFAQLFSLTAGLLVIFFAAYNIRSQFNVLGISMPKLSLSGEKATNLGASAKVDSNGKQILSITAQGFQYSPRFINLKAGIPTKMVINASGVSGCANALYARGLYNDVVYLKPGLNEVEIPSPQKGTYKISCSMGMVDPITVTVN